MQALENKKVNNVVLAGKPPTPVVGEKPFIPKRGSLPPPNQAPNLPLVKVVAPKPTITKVLPASMQKLPTAMPAAMQGKPSVSQVQIVPRQPTVRLPSQPSQPKTFPPTAAPPPSKASVKESGYATLKSIGVDECSNLMCEAGINDKKEAMQWLIKHHPDKGGEPTKLSLSDVTNCMSKKQFCSRKKTKTKTKVNGTRKAENDDLSKVFQRAQFKSPTKTGKPAGDAVAAYPKNAKQLQCIRQVSNWSKIGPESRFDKKRFSIERTDKLIPLASPKLEAMLQNIEALDANDLVVHGKKFKHFIFSDIKLMGYGSKIIAAAMMARGWKNILKQEFRKTKRGNQKSYLAIEVPKGVSDKNFAVLSSTPMWEAPFSHVLKKEVLGLYNSRPDNIFGEKCRMIVLDSGFKEGIDLFDVRYVHLFEPLMTAADQTQALGRATRLCGQKGLDFVPNVGWPLHVFKYSQSIPEVLNESYKAKNMFEIMLQLKGLDTRLHRITKSINDMSILAAVDQPLTEEIHKSGLLPHIEIKKASTESVEVVRTEETMNMQGSTGRTNLMNSKAKSQLLLQDGPLSEVMADQDLEDDDCAKAEAALAACGKASIVPFAPSRLSQRTVLPTIVTENNMLVIRQPTVPPKPVKGIPTTWFELRRYVVDKYGKMAWGKQSVENKCGPPTGGAKKAVAVASAPAAVRVVPNKTAKAKKNAVLVKGAVKGTKQVKVTAKAKAAAVKAVKAEKAEKAVKVEPKKAAKVTVKVNKVPAKAAKPAKATKKNELRSSGIPAPVKRAKLPALKLIDYTPTQDFISSYFTVQSPIKGMILWHSVGTGKTCTAIATASRQFEPAGYTILWVTRHTLKADIWKNIFEQVCHAAVAAEVRKGTLKPQDVEKRQKKMFENWIPPMSYRQFSNLVTAQNPLYKVLVERNGREDPLRKTLIVIDEAHKLYSSDFKGAEKPDVGAFRKALQTSYKVSGQDSARVLLMTATPYNESPIELMNLLNLCRVQDKWLPETIPEFLEKYMDDKGNFTKDGLHTYMDDVAGQISYLNREADPSQFAQPIFAEVVVPISTYDMEGTEGNEKLQEILQDIEGLEAEHTDLQDNVIPYLKTQVGLIQPAMDSHMRECNETHEKPKDVRACQKRVEQTYKAALKTEGKNLKAAEKKFLDLEKNKRKLEKKYKSTTKKLHKMSVTQQAQFEGKCKLGAGAPRPKSTRKKAPTEKVPTAKVPA